MVVEGILLLSDSTQLILCLLLMLLVFAMYIAFNELDLFGSNSDLTRARYCIFMQCNGFGSTI